MSSSTLQYLRSGTVLISQSPTYDDKGRQMPFEESPLQMRERHIFLKGLQSDRKVTTWMHDQRRARSTTSIAPFSSPSSSESSSPRTPASPLNVPQTYEDMKISYEEKMKRDTIAALDDELARLVLASRQVAPPPHRQSRNYKNLHLTTNTTTRQSLQDLTPPIPKRVPATASTPTRGIFDSPPSTNSGFSSPSARSLLHHNSVDKELNSSEPYILYSSSVPFPTSTVLSTTATPKDVSPTEY